jgi:hypothetical protein
MVPKINGMILGGDILELIAEVTFLEFRHPELVEGSASER